MKKTNIRLVFSIVLFSAIMMSSGVFGQGSDPPPPPGGHGSSNNIPPGGGAPIGSGLVWLVLMGMGYGARKIFALKKEF